MGLTSIMAIFGMVMRLTTEAPHLIAEVEEFWNKIAPKVAAPPHVEAAIQAAFVKLHEGEVG